MEKSKKLLQKEMGENKLLIEENELLFKNNRGLASINETLVRSQRQYEEKWRKLFHALQFYKEFYHKYLELTLSNVTNKSQDFQTLEKYKEQHSNFELLIRDPEKLINEKRRKEQEAGTLVNVSILDLNDEHIKEENKLDQLLLCSEKENFKQYLLNLAKDVNLLCKKTLIRSNNSRKELEEEKLNLPIVKFKKSLSNPIDYRTEIQRNLLENLNKQMPITVCEKKVMKMKLNVNNFNLPMKSPAFGNNNNNKGEEKDIVEDLGLESPGQIIYHTNYEEEEMVEENGIKE